MIELYFVLSKLATMLTYRYSVLHCCVLLVIRPSHSTGIQLFNCSTVPPRLCSHCANYLQLSFVPGMSLFRLLCMLLAAAVCLSNAMPVSGNVVTGGTGTISLSLADNSATEVREASLDADASSSFFNHRADISPSDMHLSVSVCSVFVCRRPSRCPRVSIL
jgi:hypothetical protein